MQGQSPGSTSYISPRAELGKRVRIGAGVQIFGNVTIGDDTVIDADVTLGYPKDEAIRRFLGHDGLGTPEELLEYATSKPTFIGPGSLVRRFSVFYEGVKIGEQLDCAHGVIIREGCSLGDMVELGPLTYIKSDAKIGDSTRIAGLICDRATIGRHCTVYGSVIHKFLSGISGMKEDSPVLEDGVVVGREACVVGPVTVGRLSLIGAGSVVTHSVEEKSVAAGNPARILRHRERAEAAELWTRIEGSGCRE
jgi:serine acetyltransferase